MLMSTRVSLSHCHMKGVTAHLLAIHSKIKMALEIDLMNA